LGDWEKQENLVAKRGTCICFRIMPIDRLLGEFGQRPGVQGALGGAASGALVSLLMNKKARKTIGKSAMQVGTAAAVAGIGYLAYKKWQERRGSPLPASAGGPSSGAAAPVPPARFAPPSPVLAISDSFASRMALVMMAAAHADGTIDAAELDALARFIDTAELSAAEKARLTAALNEPPGLEAISALPTNLEEASELYAAALGAIDLDSPAEHLFLRRLARSFGLDDALVASLHALAREAGEAPAQG
jgi:uncharacterized membrane protein YebE (DUF533 family)